MHASGLLVCNVLLLQVIRQVLQLLAAGLDNPTVLLPLCLSDTLSICMKDTERYR